MKSVFLLLTTLLLATLQGPAFADRYAGLSYSQSRIGALDSANVGGIFVKLGQSWSENIHTELRLGGGLENDDGFGELGIESLVGTYFRFGLEADDFYPHLLLGYTQIDLETSFGSTGSDSDLSYGIGTDYEFKEDWKVNVEYIVYYDKDDVDVKSVSLGFFLRLLKNKPFWLNSR